MSGAVSAAPPPVEPRRLRLRAQVLILLAIALAPAAVLAIVQAVRAYQSEVRELEVTLAQTARLAATDYATIINGARDVLRNLAAQADVLAGGPACNAALLHATEGLPQLVAVVRSDANGRIICAGRTEAIGIDLSDRDWFRELVAGREFVVSDLLASRVVPSASGLVVARRLVGEAGEIVGALSVLVDLGSLAPQYLEETLPRDSAFGVLDGTGNVLSQSDIAMPLAGSLPAIEEGGTRRLRAAVFRATAADGVERMYVVEPMLEQRLFVMLGVPAAQALNPLTWRAAQLILTPVLMWLLTAGAIWFGLERLVIRWLRYLERIASLYASGRRSVRPERIGEAPAEIASLGTTFIRMADQIDEHDRRLRESLAQKEVLVREVHHRVKNNLQLVMSLLSLHGRRVRDPAAERAFTDVRERITALATLHRRLYESETLETVDLKWFLEDLCRELRKGGLAVSQPGRIEADLESVPLVAEKAVPLGLLVTEAISNSFRHAFVGRSQGVVRVSGRVDGGDLVVTVADNGIGIADPASGRSTSGLGRSLMESFARQLGGPLAVRATREGTVVEVRFPCEPPC